MNHLSQWTIGRRIGFLCSVLLIELLVIGGVGFWSARALNQEIESQSLTMVPASRNMTLMDMMHDGLRAVVYTALHGTATDNEDEKKSANEDYKEMSESFTKYLATLESLNLSKEIRAEIATVKPTTLEYVAAAGEILELTNKRNYRGAEEKLPHFNETFGKLEKDLGKLGDLIEDEAKKQGEHAVSTGSRIQTATIWILALGMLFGVGLTIHTSRSIFGALSNLAGRLETEASNLKFSVTNVSGASQSLANSSTEQAAALQETAASIEEMNAMIKKSSDNAESSRDASQHSAEVADRGLKAVNELTRAIEDINESNTRIMEQVNAGNQQFGEIVKVINDIGNKTKVINDIVFQTKLLSFNASVEAARAGEHGKGFAVVAEEVGNLAQMSGNAAREISEMLKSSSTRVESIVSETRSKVERLITEGRSKVESGINVSRECGQILNDVVKTVNNVNGMISEISTATHEQSQGTNEISKAMHELDSATHANSAVSTKVAETASELLHQSDQLVSIVHGLNRMIRGFETTQSNPETPKNVIQFPENTRNEPPHSKVG